MKIEIEIPDKYADQLEAVEDVDPSVREQIEIEVLPEVLRLITDAHRQLEQQQASVTEQESGDG